MYFFRGAAIEFQFLFVKKYSVICGLHDLNWEYKKRIKNI